MTTETPGRAEPIREPEEPGSPAPPIQDPVVFDRNPPEREPLVPPPPPSPSDPSKPGDPPLERLR